MKIDYKPRTVKELLQWAVFFLGKEKRLEAEVLLAYELNMSRASLLAYPEKIVCKDKVYNYIFKANKLKEDIPLQYLTRIQNFMGLDFEVNENVLIPRSDTEVLVEAVIEAGKIMNKNLQILDLCTGSGAIAISLAKYMKNVKVFAADISEGAVETAKLNARKNEVEIEFKTGNLFEPLCGKNFDIIVSNPPYISNKEMEELPENVKKEPIIALWGGEDGLYFYRKIIVQAVHFLNEKGLLMLEIGWKQGKQVKELFKNAGYSDCKIIQDWAARDRVIKAQK